MSQGVEVGSREGLGVTTNNAVIELMQGIGGDVQ